MNTKSIVGLVQKSDGLVEDQLTKAGLKKENFLKERSNGDFYLLSVKVDSEEQLESAKRVFTALNSSQIYEFSFVAESESRIRAYVEAAAKTEIFELPKARSHGEMNDGLNSEMVMGDKT